MDSSPSQVLDLFVDLMAVPASAVWHAFDRDSAVVVRGTRGLDAIPHEFGRHGVIWAPLLADVLRSSLLLSDPVCKGALRLLEGPPEALLKSLLPLPMLFATRV